MGSIRQLWIVIALVMCWSTESLGAEAKYPEKKVAATTKSENSDVNPKPAVADEKTAALLDRMESLEYVLAKEGVKKATGKGEAIAQIPNQPEAKSEVRFDWDGSAPKESRGKITLSNEALAPLLNTDTFEGIFNEGNWREDYAGCRLVTSEDKGMTTVRVAEGKSKTGFISMTLNAEGLPAEVVMMAPPELTRGAAASNLNMKVTWVKLGGKFLVSRITLLMGTTMIGEVIEEHKQSGKFTVIDKIIQKASPMGVIVVTTVTFLDWQLDTKIVNERVKEANDEVTNTQEANARSAKKEVRMPGGQELPQKRHQLIAEDFSLGVEDYVRKGVPSTDREWSSKDFLGAVKALSEIAREDVRKLPRAGSRTSGRLFERIISKRFLKDIEEAARSLDFARISVNMEYIEGLKQANLLYANASLKIGAAFDVEIIAIQSIILRIVPIMAEFGDRFIESLPAEKRTKNRIEGLQQMKAGYVEMVRGTILGLSDRQFVRPEETVKLAGALEEVLPRFFPHIANKPRSELVESLRKMADAELEPSIKSAIIAILKAVGEFKTE
jgi:hypothetical protein